MSAPSPSSDAACPACGWTGAAGDEYCERCGMRLEDAPAAQLAPGPDLGAASHVGRSHPTNEDAVAVGRRERDGRPVYALVVCDGISSSAHGETASSQAASAALAVLIAAAESTGPIEADAALTGAVQAAHRAVCEAAIAAVEGKDPPGTTIVAALVDAGRVHVGWVGDSRAYIVPPDAEAPFQLTRDDSWVNAVVSAGQMTEEEAMQAPYAHALTRCLGPVEDPDPEAAPDPSLVSAIVEPGSRVVLCSDGLWNYVPHADGIAALVRAAAPGTDARALAEQMVRHALEMGGHDDVTVAVAMLGA